jgi:hypothetical protein
MIQMRKIIKCLSCVCVCVCVCVCAHTCSQREHGFSIQLALWTPLQTAWELSIRLGRWTVESGTLEALWEHGAGPSGLWDEKTWVRGWQMVFLPHGLQADGSDSLDKAATLGRWGGAPKRCFKKLLMTSLSFVLSRIEPEDSQEGRGGGELGKWGRRSLRLALWMRPFTHARLSYCRIWGGLEGCWGSG